MAFYEFTEEENSVFKGLSLRMNIVGVLMIVVGLALLIVGLTLYSLSIELLLLTASGILLFVMGYLTFRSAKRFMKIVETQGHDIMYLMEAMNDLKRYYTLVVALILAIAALAAITATFVQPA